MKVLIFLLFLAASAFAASVSRSKVGEVAAPAPAWALPETPFSLGSDEDDHDDDDDDTTDVAASAGVRGDDGKCVCELSVPSLLGRARGPFAVKLDAQEVKINRLTARIQKLSDELDARLAEADKEGDHVAELTAKLNAFKGDGCPKGQFQCGTDDGCISDVLVCDGSNDCSNGRDEQRCNITSAVGTSWKGDVTWDQCTARHPKSITLAITKITQLDWFPSRPKVEGLLILERETENAYKTDSLLLKGVFDFGGRQVVFSAPEQDGLAFRCQFDGLHPDRCTGNVFRESTGLSCAEVVMQRVNN